MKALKKGLYREYLLIVFALILTSVLCQDSQKVPNFNSTKNEEKGCVLEDGTSIEFGESRKLPGCEVLRCIKTDNSFALIHVSCETSKNDFPPGCEIVPRPEPHFPKCCEIVLHCKNSMTHVFPVVSERKNISQVEHDDSINTVGISEPRLNEIISSDVIKRSNIGKIRIRTRYKRELSSSVETTNSNGKETKKTKGCVTEHGFINTGDEFILPGCSKLRCIETEEDVALVMVSCPHDLERLPKGCRVVPPITQKPFPECCRAKLVCIKKIIEVVPSLNAKNNISLITGEDEEDFNTSKVKVVRKFKKSSISPKEIIKNSQNRFNRDLRTQSNETVEESVKKCVTENGTLFEGEVIPLPGCQEKKCLSINGSYNIAHLGCDVTTVEVPEGCKMLNSTLNQFPKCCEITFACEEKITELFESVYTPYNISKVNLNNTESSVENHKSKELSGSSVNLKVTKEEINNETSRANSERNLHSRTNIGNSTEDVIGCPTDTGIIRLKERVPMPNCSQLRCVNKKNSLTLMMVSCKETKVHIPPGCEVILSPSDIYYPECCQVTFKCLKEVVKIIPIKYTPDNIIKQTKNETDKFDSNTTDVDFENITINPSPVEALAKESEIFDSVKSNSTDKSISKKRSKRENALKTDESLGNCATPNGNLGVGDALTVSGCAEIRCVSSNSTTSLVLVRCKITEKEIPQGCTLVPQETLNFPLCCMARFECINVIKNAYPVSYTPENINKVGLSKKEILAERRKKNVTPLQMPLRKERELKNSSYPRGDAPLEGCNTQHGMILKEGETMTLEGCSQLRCVMIDGALQMVTVGCSKDNVTLKDGCQLVHRSQSDQFPECCVVEMDCEIPITYSDANLSHFNEMRPSNNNDIRKGDKKYFQKREKREEALQTSVNDSSVNDSRRCVTSNGSLKIGESVGLPNCAELKCISDKQELTLIVVSCPLAQDQVEKGCTIVQNSSSEFPKCCEVTLVCVNVTKNEYPVVYAAANISDLPRNISENLISPLAIRRRRETQKPTEVRGCNIKTDVLKPGQFIALKNCARLECLETKDDFYLAVASCPPNKVTVPTGCKIVPKSDAHYPECCEIVMVCKKVIKEVIPVVYTAANISSIDANDKENLLSYSTIPVEDLKLRMDTSETQKSRRILKARFVSENDSKTLNSSLVEDTSKSPPNNSNTKERTRRITRKPNSKLRTTPKNESKPSFFLPSKKRTSRNRRIEKSDTKVNETIELKNTMFITASPTRIQSSSSDGNTTNIPSTRRRLSSLLSSRNLRINTTPKSQAASESQSKPQNNRSKTGINQKHSKDESKKDQRFIIETSDKNETLPEKVVKRRNIYASRLNKYIAKIENNEKAKIAATKNQTKDEQPKKKTSLNKKSKKEKKKSKEVKKKKKKSKGKKSGKKKSTKTITKTDTNSSLRRRLRTRPKTSVKVVKPEKKEEIIKKDDKSENKKEEESKTLPVRSRSNFNKKEEISKKDNQAENKKQEESKNLPVRSRSNFNKQEKISKKDNKSKEKKKEESKKLIVRSRSNVNKEKKSEKKEELKKLSEKGSNETKNIKREKKPKETITRAPRRRTQAIKELKDVKKVEPKPRTKETTGRRKSKPSFELKSTKEEKGESKLKDFGRGKVIFDASKLNTKANKTESTNQAIKTARPSIRERGSTNINKTESTNKAIKTARPSGRDRGSRRRVKNLKEKLEDIKKDKEIENDKEKESKEAKTIILEHTTETSKKEEKKDDTKPEPIPKTNIKITENEIGTIPPDFEAIYNSEYSFIPSSLDDFDSFYKYPINDLVISSSDKEDSKSPDTKENEIIDIPDPPKVPMKITTVSFSTSRRSYKTSKTRNTSKNFKKTPTVYDKKETFQSAVFKR